MPPFFLLKSEEPFSKNINSQGRHVYLAKAFRSELTADWRKQNPALITGENSAEVLLARIKTERAKLTPENKTRKKKWRVKRRIFL